MLDSKKKAILATFVFFAVFLFATATINHEKRKNAPSNDVIVTDSPIVFYYGYNCPHCELVEKYLDENNVASKVKFSKKEVYKNPANAAEAIDRAAQCGIGADELGVPFLWDGANCYVGDQNIIDFFSKKVQETEKSGSGAAEEAAAQASVPAASPAAQTAAEGAQETASPVAGAMLYYSASCPHCKVVEEYIETNRVEEKFRFARKEISQVAANQQDFIAAASDCGVAPESLGVPMLYAEGRCYLGQEPIINFFKEKTDEQ